MSRKTIMLIVVILVLVLALPVLFALLGWWEPIFHYFGG
jgi:hypothetical protein